MVASCYRKIGQLCLSTICPFIHLFVHLFNLSSIHSTIHSSIHSFIYLSIHSFNHPSIHPLGNYQQALQYYEEIHKRFPDNVDCLKFLVRLHSDLGRKELSDHYSSLLKKAEKNNEIKKQVSY